MIMVVNVTARNGVAVAIGGVQFTQLIPRLFVKVDASSH